MGINEYDEVVEDLAEQQGPAAPPQEDFSDPVRRMAASRERSLKQAFIQAAETTPDRAAEARTLSLRFGVPPAVVERNLEFYQRRAGTDRPFGSIQRETPALADWARDPNNAKLAADDMEQLGALEWLLTAPGRAFAQGINQVRFGQLKAKSLWGPLTREEQDLANSYKFQMELGGGLGAGESWFNKAVIGGSQQLPNLFGAALYAAKYGGPAALVGGVAGGIAGSIVPAVGTWAGAGFGARLGMRLGGLAGAARFGFEIEAGNALDEYEQFHDERGQPLDPDVARAAAIATGAINAGLEAAGFQVLVKSIPGLNKLGALGVRAAVKKALLKPTIRAGLLEAVKSYGKTLGFESVTEVSQRFVTIMSGELGKAASGQTIEARRLLKPSTTGEPSILEDLGREGLGALQAFAFTVAGGPVLQAAHAQAQARRAEDGSTFFKALGEGVGQSKTFERLPEAARGFIERVTKDGPLEHVYAPVASWLTYWQAQGVDPAAIAAEVTGERDALERAQKTGEDLVIPTARYAVTLAATEHNRFFADELRLAPDEMNAREAQAFTEALKAATEGKPTVEAEPGLAVRQAVTEQLIAAGIPEATASSYADLYHQTFGTLAERAGIDPLELYRQYGFTVSREGLEETAPAAATAPAATELPLGPVAAPTTEGAAAASAPSSQLAAVEPEVAGLAALEAELAGATIQQVMPEGAAVNASAESAASQEAIARRESMQAAGQVFGVYNRAGTFRPLVDVGAQDYVAAKGETFGILSREGFQVLTAHGGKVPLDTTADVANNIEARHAATGATAPTGAELRRGPGEQPGADERGLVEGPSDELRAQPRELPAPDPDEIFRRATPEANAARFTPEVTRELERVLDELETFPYVGRTWTWLSETELSTGNAAGGKANIVAGAAGAEVYHDILAFAPVHTVTSGRRKGQPAKLARGNRSQVSAAIGAALQNTDIATNLAEGAIRVAERRAIGDYSVISLPMLPARWGTEASVEFTDALSAAIDDALAPVNMLDATDAEQDLLEPEGPVDTSFNVEEFHQSLLDQLEPPSATDNLTTPAADKVDVLDTGEQQPRLPGDVGAVRDLNVQAPEFELPFALTPPPAAAAKGKQTTLFQPVYHGSAQRFERFSLHAVGTGEGAQAYGWGLYFASLREVAEQYRKSLAGPGFDKGLALDGERIFGPGKPTDLYLRLTQDPTMHTGLLELYARAYFEKPGKAGIAHLHDMLRRSIANLVRRLDAGETWSGDRARDAYDLEKNRAALQVLDTYGDRLDILPPDKPGRTYKVEIPEDEDFLSWDHAASRQSPKVQAALEQLRITWTPDKTPTLREAAHLFETKHVLDLAREDVGIRDTLREGRHYVLTADHVAFDLWYQRNAGLFRARGRLEPTGEGIYETVLARVLDEELTHARAAAVTVRTTLSERAEKASRLLYEAGIAGIRYLDGFSRNKGEGTSNYVVFDDRLVQITEFYQSQAGGALTTADVQDWAEELRGKIGPDVEALDLHLTQLGDLRLDVLAIRRGAARAGLGTRVMQEVTRYADRNGLRLVLSLAKKGYQPIAGGVKTTSASRLERFYRRFGFVRNAGRYADLALTAGMYREPTLAPGLEVPIQAPVLTQTAAFKEWFGESQVRNDDGTPKVAHHGTARGDRVGNIFRKSRATSGPMAFFTESAEIAKKYSETKADTSLEAPEDYAGWFKMMPKGARTEVDLRRAWWSLTPEQQRTVIERLPLVGYQNPDEASGPIVYPSKTITSESHVAYLLGEARGNGLVAAMELWLSSGSLFGDESQFLDVLKGLDLENVFRLDDPEATHPRVYDVYLSIQNPFRTGAISDEVLAAFDATAKRSRQRPAQFGADLWDKRLRNIREWVAELKADRAAGKNSHVWTSIPDAISDTLKTLGYDGIEDTGGKLGGDEHVIWIPFEPTQIKSVENRGTFDPLNPNILKQEKRGAIRFGPDRQFSIALLEKADLSTFLHESGHFFLEVFGDLADRFRATDPATLTATQRTLVSDFDGLLEQLGVETRDAITETQHEQFARLFEAYLMEGRAPSLALESAFVRFRAWLVGIYRSLRQLHVQLTPEVTAILDRLVASDLAIAEAEQRRGVDAMFTTAETAGMTAAEFGLYRETVARASRTARQRLDAKLLGEVRREQEESWKAQRAEIQAEVEAAIYERPEYRALSAITRGTHPNGEALVEGLETKPLRLSRALIVEAFGPDRLKRLPAFSYVRDGGLDPESVAGMFGFSSADALLTALEDAPPMRQVIDQQTQARMLAEHGSLLLDGTLAEAAQTAVANEDRDSIIRAELRALGQLRRTVAPFVQAEQTKLEAERAERAYERRWFEAEAKLKQAIAVGKKALEIEALRREVMNWRQKARGGAATIAAALPPQRVIEDHARTRLGRMTIRAIKPALFWSGSRRAAEEAIGAAARQDFDGAIAAKQRELLNLALYRQAEVTLEDMRLRVIFAKSLNTKAARARLGLAGANYQEQVDGILDAYEFARVPAKALEKRASLSRFLAGLEAAGLPVPPDLPPELVDETRRTNYQNLTVEELIGVTDGLKMIVHLARLKNKLLKAQDAREFDEVRTSIVESIRAHSDERTLPSEFTGKQEATRRLADWFASHTKIAQLAAALDGYVDGGPVWQYVIRPINEAADQESARNHDAGVTYTQILNRFYTSKDLRAFSRPLRIEAIGESLTKEARLALALNWGNQTSRDRVLADPRRKWTQQQVDAILGTLDKRDWDFIQATWDFLETFWPEIVAKQERVVGVAPEKVDALPVQTAYGEYRGGYYPLMYDPRLNLRSQQLEAASEARGILQAAYVANTTKRGHLEARKSHVKLSIRLDLGVTFQHLQQVIHDLTHHEALLDVQRVLRDSSISSAILETKGDIVYQQFSRALQDIAAGNVNGRRPTIIDKAATFARQGTQLSLLGINLWTAAQQPLGLFNGMARIGPKWVARGLKHWLRDAAHMEHTVRWINSVSPMMKYRLDNATQDLSDLRLELRRAGGWFDRLVRKVSADHLTQTALLDGYLWHIGLMQRVADVPTWLGMYEKSKAGGKTEADAIALADQAVLDSQGAGQIKDLSQVQRGGPVARLFMTFYTYGNTVFNQTARALGQTSFRSPVQILELLGNLALIYAMPSLVTILLSRLFGRTGGEDDDWSDFFQDVGAEMLSTAMNTMVLVRELGGLVESGTRGYAGPAGARLIELSYKVGRQVEQGELDEAFFRAVNQAGGILFRYPAAQIQRTVDGIAALEEGRTSNPLAILFGPPQKEGHK